MEITVTFEGDALAALSRLGEGMSDGASLHAAMAFGVEAGLRDHLDVAGYVGRVNALGGKSTGFWKAVSNSVASEATAADATVSISHRGVALQYFGGTVKPVNKKALSVPVHASAHGLSARQYPGDLAFIPASKQFGPFRAGGGQDTVGYLVRGKATTITRGPNKGKSHIVPMGKEEGGELIYVLRSSTYHAPDPGILPTDDALRSAAASAGGDYLDAIQ